MPRIVLIHANAAEGLERVQALKEAGFEAETAPAINRSQMQELRERTPDAFLIDLSRVPSQGQAIAVWLRQQKELRRTPIIFVGGTQEKLERAHQFLPDVPAAGWEEILPALREAIAHPPENPVVPGTFDGYSGTPLPKKLGIKPGVSIALLDAPEGFEHQLKPLPDDVQLSRGLPGGTSAYVILLFARSLADLAEKFPAAASALGKGGRLWIVWPKRTSGIQSDLSERNVREFGLAAGFVDYKISAIDQTWSGLCFARRKPGKVGQAG